LVTISLNKNKDIDNTFCKGRTVVTPVFLCKYTKDATGTKKVAIKISSKKVKTAVCRNKIKRWIKESLKDLFKQYAISANMVIVFRYMPNEPLTYKSVYTDIESILAKIS